MDVIQQYENMLDKSKKCKEYEAIGSVEECREAVKKVKEYRQLEEQGILIKLPCPIGTPVWDTIPTLYQDRFELSMLPYINVSIFLTEKEAKERISKLDPTRKWV